MGPVRPVRRHPEGRPDRLYRETFDDAHDEGSEAYALLPGGLPGFVDSTRRVLLRVPCPALGRTRTGSPGS
ncbi:hypothetical protein [Streptomyces sp. KL116D]|uniref:hypothetical protein n=1 Tax=Streptomyces sp. KL116D TaxID=3045152 RepID=UPI0035581218